MYGCVADDVAHDRLLDRSTSGSTGERVIVKRTWLEERLLNAFRWRAMRDYGYRARDRRALVHFSSSEDPRDDQSLQRLVQRTGPFRRRVFDAIADPDLAPAVAAFDPDCITGMASAVARLADEAGANGHRLRPRFVVAGGELLTEPLRAHRVPRCADPRRLRQQRAEPDRLAVPERRRHVPHRRRRPRRRGARPG